MIGVVYQEAADWERRNRRHELSHHIAGRGGGWGGIVLMVSMRPPQQGQT
jgi:hypothetical protein